jgi:hypothetical protein
VVAMNVFASPELLCLAQICATGRGILTAAEGHDARA